MRVKAIVNILVILFCLLPKGAKAAPETLRVGIAKIDITPDYPVRLNGFGSRRTESEGVTQQIHAEALAFEDKQDGPAVIITVDNLAVSDEITLEVAELLAKSVSVKRERLAISATHTHTAPMLKNVSPTLFGNPIPPEHQAHIDQYTREFVKKLQAVAVAAVKDIRPAVVSWGCGNAGFAMNRRTKGGPVDHDLPVMMISDPDGKVRGVYFSYACHCVTLSNNKLSGDWAGLAKDAIEKAFPGAIALASVGCGADSNPTSGVTGDRVAAAEEQGKQIADEIKRLVAAGLKPIKASPQTRYTRIEVPFDTPRTRAEWEERTKSADYAIAYHAKVNLERLDRGEELPRAMTYPIATWLFGDDLAMVFLPGETVVDYALRIKREFDRNRIWINGYANESRCYLPSERILAEGGYEGGGAMVYYDRPQRFAPGIEAKIMAAVTPQLPKSWATAGSEGIPPKRPDDALSTFHTHAGLKVELVAAEPLIQSPVAIDWGADGKLWVCEMYDYPAGPRGDYEPGGRVCFLEDTNHDGSYDKSTIFLRDIPFPTGVMAWGKGVLVCAAPDILYAEDTDGDGKADKIQKLYSGFATENYQARVNSLSLGLDNWIYGANGLISRSITTPSGPVDIRNHDFRFRPLNGVFEPVSGPTQQGLVRDDWGLWFGCANSDVMWYYPHEERYLRRNPNVPVPAAMIWPAADHDVNRVYPTSRLLERFNDPGAANRMTSGCGISIYRDALLGEAYRDNTFTCEPVHNLVTRLVLGESNGQMTRRRAEDEKTSEFLSSTDNWFRPVQTRTGPDGALYVVDMYRFVIEHPRWIPAARLAKLNVRAGADMGRIYRLIPVGQPLRAVPNLAGLDARALVRELDSPNGTERDRVHAELLVRNDRKAAPALERLATSAAKPEVRVQALCVLDGLGALQTKSVQTALKDSDPRVRRHAVRLCETFMKPADGRNARALVGEMLKLEKDSSPIVLHQLAYTLGEWDDPRAGQVLGRLAVTHSTEGEMKTAVLSSATRHCGAVMDAIVANSGTSSKADWISLLAATAAASGNDELLAKALAIVTPSDPNKVTVTELATLAKVLDALKRKNISYSKFISRPSLQGTDKHIQNAFEVARNEIVGKGASPEFREAAVRLIGTTAMSSSDLELVGGLLLKSASTKLQTTVFDVLRHQENSGPATYLINHWPQLPPTARPAAISLLVSRDEASRAMLQAVEQGIIRPTEISLQEKQSLMQKSDPQIRELAAKAFPARAENRGQVLEKYQATISLSGSSAKGMEVFKTSCATCHLLDGIGHDVGPDLATLRNKDADYFIKNILDPNAAVEPRFVNYEVTTKDGRALSGIIKSETATAITLVAGNGVTEVLKPGDAETIQASSLSLMPEGLEQAITPQDMADLIAFLRNTGAGKTGEVASPGTLVREPVAMARIILDGSQPNDIREALIGANPQFASEFVAEMTRDLTPGTPEEYVRIPWIWRVAIAAGKRNDPGEIKRLLAVSLPSLSAPLRDWQAVVIGGGVINGLSLKGVWPAERLAEILAGDAELGKRWASSLELAVAMADDAKVPSGTRYDALRMLGVLPWNQSGERLAKYLAKGIHAELQQGAISGLCDVRSPKVGPTLASGLAYFSKSNRDFALDALVRDESRIAVLLDEIAAGRVAKAELKRSQIERLNGVTEPALARRVRELALKLSEQTSR